MALSEEFQTPVAVAVHLLDPAVSATPMTPAESETKEMEVKEEPQNSQDTGTNVSQIFDWQRTLTGLIYRLAHSDRCHRRPLLPKQQLLRLGLGVIGFPWVLSEPAVTLFHKGEHSRERVDHGLGRAVYEGCPAAGVYVDAATVARSLRAISTPRQEYPLRAVILIALIAFLLGSLLRSLLSPSDFIYVVTDVGSLEQVEGGWREIRRLVEVKYLVGGWDFQIAVVRRH
jgi:hypothetical protein